MRLAARDHHAQRIMISVVPVVANRSDIPEVPAAAGRALRRLPAQGRQEERVEAGGVGMNQMSVDMDRCPRAKTDLYVQYHDSEWGVPVHDDRLLFEFLILEGAQAGLSWETILKKRVNYRAAFDQFDPASVAKYGQKKRKSLLSDAGIVRNRLKIEAAIQSAKMFLAVQNEFGTFDEYIWGFVGDEPKQNG